jgi:hypothetical protein
MSDADVVAAIANIEQAVQHGYQADKHLRKLSPVPISYGSDGQARGS